MIINKIADLEVNGIKLKASIQIQVDEDRDYDLKYWDDPRDRQRIKSGELFVAWVCVTATALEIEGTDSLSGCTLRPNNLFDSNPFETDLDAILTDNQMVENALSDLAKNIVARAKALKEFA